MLVDSSVWIDYFYGTENKESDKLHATLVLEEVATATYCIENKQPLLFTDKDFLPFVKHLRLRSVY